jgi:CheY-like chemotaxis protein
LSNIGGLGVWSCAKTDYDRIGGLVKAGDVSDKTILLIDDDEVIHYLVQRACRNVGRGAKVETAMNGRLALELFEWWFREEASLPDVVLVDINMPVMGGVEFIEEVEILSKEFGAASPPCRFCIFTSSQSLRDIARVEALNWIESYLVKPMNISECEAIVLNLLNDHATD